MIQGDHNTKFFHALVVKNRRKNFISSLKDDIGIWIDNMGGIKDHLLEKFMEVYTTPIEIEYSTFLPILIYVSMRRKTGGRVVYLPQWKLSE